jgi:hypothetical protein
VESFELVPVPWADCIFDVGLAPNGGNFARSIVNEPLLPLLVTALVRRHLSQDLAALRGFRLIPVVIADGTAPDEDPDVSGIWRLGGSDDQLVGAGGQSHRVSGANRCAQVCPVGVRVQGSSAVGPIPERFACIQMTGGVFARRCSRRRVS